MSKLIKAAKKGLSKAWKFVKKTVKKITSSKLFKAVAIAAAIYFTAGAAAGMIGATGAAGAGSAGVGNMVAGMAANGASVATATTAATTAATSVGSVASTLGSVAKGVGAWAQANPLLASTVATTSGQIIGGYSQSKAQQDAYDEQREELDANAAYTPNIAEQLKSVRPDPFERHRNTSEKYQQSVPQDTTPVSYYDDVTDTYRTS